MSINKEEVTSMIEQMRLWQDAIAEERSIINDSIIEMENKKRNLDNDLYALETAIEKLAPFL